MGQKPFVELLAPAGNIEAFIGAIHAGADAVYLGGNRFGARAYAENFTEDELIWCIRYAHLFGRKVYLTVNTLVKECEFDGIFDFIKPFYTAGLDGVIVQDIGVLSFLRDNFPELELHASTQMTISSAYGAEFVKKLGVSRVVPARELGLNEIKDIREKTGLEIESFIHGAMCYCYSGQCLFSSILGGRSGNRGRCAQPCRLPYEAAVNGRKSGICYPLSLKDMCTIEYLPDLIEAGIYSFKIEGRMKKPEYSAGVTSIYRKYIDMYLADRDAYRAHSKVWSILPGDLDKLSKIYIRSEIQSGYYYKHNGSDMVTIDNPSYSGSDEELLRKIRSRYIDNRIKYNVDVTARFVKGESAKVIFTQGDISVSVCGDIVQTAQKQPVTSDNIAKQLKKLGETSFEVDKIVVNSDEDAFYPIGRINELRRDAVAALERKITEDKGFPYERSLSPIHDEEDIDGSFMYADAGQKKSVCAVSVKTLEQLGAAAEYDFFERLYIDSDLLVCNPQIVISISRRLREKDKRLFIALPYVIRMRDDAFLDKLEKLVKENADIFSGIQVKSIDGLGYLQKTSYDGDIYADAGLYIWNNRTLSELKSYIKVFCIPYELKLSEQKNICAGVSREKVVYGRIPMMITANCIANTTYHCMKNQEKTAVLTDRYGKNFPVFLDCVHCMNVIYNSVPVSLHLKMSGLQGWTDFRIDLTVENTGEARNILKYFEKVINGENPATPPYQEYTTGHDKRGVE